ncbi:hypothetical protein [uncultured Idiomarina sp.]|uniref:hypothetical protein n=1 Tax=uncultured Idiomarina sp. TaxID=352961 RepID=UPI002593181F|nr:hypothetical protein [uncultured Idiomarina sp.]
MCDLLFSFQEFLKIVPGLAIFPLTFYLAWRKIGRKVSCSLTVGSDRISEERITSIVLTNHKDSPVAIFEVSAVCEDDISLSLEKPNPPIILKSLESVVIETEPYSNLTIGGDKYSPELLFGKIQVYVACSDEIIKCKMVSHPTLFNHMKFNHLTQASKNTYKFNGFVYNEKVKYAIIYNMNSEVKTAFVDHSGFISGDGDFHYNLAPQEQMRSETTVREFLKIMEVSPQFQILGVERLETTN